MESAPEEKKESILDSVFREFARRGLKLFVALFLLEVAIFLVVSLLPFFPNEQAFYQSQSNQLANELTGASWFTLFWSIFTNNLRIALLETIPGVGPALFTYSLYETARVLQITAIDQNLPAIVLAILLFIFPHSWIELPAYAVATAESLYIVYGFYRLLAEAARPGPNFDERTGERKKLSPETRVVRGIGQYVLIVAIITVMLFVAALFESTEIELESTPYFLITWIPFAVLVGVVIVLYKRLPRRNKKEEQPVYPMVIQ